MDDGMKKKFMIGIAGLCIILAIAVAFWMRPKTYDITSIDSKEMMWFKCTKCGAAYQIGTKEYFQFLHDKGEPMVAPPMICKKCGSESIYAAEKCDKCGEVFFQGSNLRDAPDKCPSCGYSAIESLKQ